MRCLSFSTFPRWTWERGTKWMLCLVLGISFAVVGCGVRSTGGPISGKVYFKDAPLKGGTVRFTSKDKKSFGVSDISEDGSYEIVKMPTGETLISVDTAGLKPQKQMHRNTPPKGAKLPAGYKMDDPVEKAKRYTEIPKQYADPDSSGLEYTVQKGKQEHDIKLK